MFQQPTTSSEEVILEKTGYVNDTVPTSLGLVAFSTDYPTTNRQYFLMQGPAYRMQATTKGYYQSPMTDFYLGYQMPTPPVPLVLKANLTLSGNANLEFDILPSDPYRKRNLLARFIFTGDDLGIRTQFSKADVVLMGFRFRVK